MIEKYSRVYAQIDLDAIIYNIEQMQTVLEPDVKIIAVIKTDGYGHGAVPICRILENMDVVGGYAAATSEEGFILRRAGLKKPIYVLGYTFPYSYEDMIRDDIHMAVFREDMLKELAEAAGKIGKQAKIHIKVDTGMSRIGIRPDTSGIEFVRKALSIRELYLEGIFTHFARADEKDKESAYKQIDQFGQFIEKIESECGYTVPMKHCSNSAGIIELPQANMDAVRAGIILYGLWPSDEVRKDVVFLKPALSLKSRIVYIKDVEAGVPVSYGGTFVTSKKTRIATIPVGYGDGYPRSLSGKGYVLIHGKKAPILGRVCMDQFMVCIDDIPEAVPGDEITLIGTDGNECITMELLGELSGRFNYELACDLGKRIPRVYFKQGEIISTKDYFEDYC